MRCISWVVFGCLVACGDKATESGHEHGHDHPTGEDTSSDPGPDSGPPDDSGTPDSGTADEGPPDTSSPDTAGPDTATPDTGDPDTGTEPPPPTDLDGDGFSVEEGDCDDLDSSLHPAREEVCDGIDNNCDGAVDEGVIPTWFLDFDGDGHGSDAFTFEGCVPLEGYVASSDDCDDSTDTVAPGALEICDGRDNDCDDDTDEDVTTTFFLDDDDDGYGDAGFTIAACEAPDNYTDNALDCDDTDASVHPAGTEACDGVDNDCDGEIDEDSAADALTFYRDADADGFGTITTPTAACAVPTGFVDNALDCDDHDNDIHPDAVELCDEEDNNCDGSIDEAGALGETTWYADADSDGYGSAMAPTDACHLPPGHLADSTDCNDADEHIHPAATEECDGQDNDCDGDTDEAGALGETTWYADTDGDGYGSAMAPTDACDLPPGHLADSTDCNDDDALIHPAATEECDGQDNDCDGDTDEAGALGEITWYADTDGDGFGSALAPTDACDLPPGHLVDATDCNDDDALIHPAATEECDGADNDCDGDTDEAGALGESTWYTDSDGDGFGLDESAVSGCAPPMGSILVGGDCDDERIAVWPGAPELCNEADDDCDGETDEAGAVDAPTWYTDADGDGYGDADSPVAACSAPDGTVSNPDDCDDTLASVFPGAPEVAGDGIDQDCDGEDLLSPLHTGSEPGWYHANYFGEYTSFVSSTYYGEGSISCPDTCAHYGLTSRGARFVCNHYDGGSGEGCGPYNDGMYGDDNCGWMVRDMVAKTENGNTEECAHSGGIMGCATGSCGEGVTWHSVECQCS